MNDAGAMSDGHRLRQRSDQLRGPAHLLRVPWCRLRASRVSGGSGREFLGQAAAFDELHREIRPSLVLPDLVDLHDVRMAQTRDGLRFKLESHQFRRSRIGPGQQHLDRHGTAQTQMPGTKDDADSARPRTASTS